MRSRLIGANQLIGEPSGENPLVSEVTLDHTGSESIAMRLGEIVLGLVSGIKGCKEVFG